MTLNIFDVVSRWFNLELPVYDHMDGYIDFILGEMKKRGISTLREESMLNTRWLEVRDDEHFHESVLHIFKEDGEYLVSTDGDIVEGSWRLLGKYNYAIKHTVRNELYDMAFASGDFLIFKKHGNHKLKSREKYFVLVREGVGAGLTWREIMEKFFNIIRSSGNFTWAVVIAIFLIGLLALGSFF